MCSCCGEYILCVLAVVVSVFVCSYVMSVYCVSCFGECILCVLVVVNVCCVFLLWWVYFVCSCCGECIVCVILVVSLFFALIVVSLFLRSCVGGFI